MTRTGFYPGAFDPIHNGHLVAASEVAHSFGLDEVVFVPTGVPWQKLEVKDAGGEGKGAGEAGGARPGWERRVSPAEDRYLMTVIATASNPRFSVSRVDIDRPGPTHTIDTLRDLRKLRGPQPEFFSTDSLAEDFPAASGFSDVASGLVSISLSQVHHFQILWFRPEILRTMIAHLRAVMETGTVPMKLKELLIVRTSQINRCEY